MDYGGACFVHLTTLLKATSSERVQHASSSNPAHRNFHLLVTFMALSSFTVGRDYHFRLDPVYACQRVAGIDFSGW